MFNISSLGEQKGRDLRLGLLYLVSCPVISFLKELLYHKGLTFPNSTFGQILQ